MWRLDVTDSYVLTRRHRCEHHCSTAVWGLAISVRLGINEILDE